VIGKNGKQMLAQRVLGLHESGDGRGRFVQRERDERLLETRPFMEMDCPLVTTETERAIDCFTTAANGLWREEDTFITLSSKETLSDCTNKRKGSDFLRWGRMGLFPAQEK
jgi:hypothetical protein